MKTAKNYATAARAAVLLTGLVSAFGAFAGNVWTNDMQRADWGYEVCGLGEKGDEFALVYTNCAVGANMSWEVPDGVHTFQFLVVGGGGGGAASQKTSPNQRPGGGGGGGGFVEGEVVIPDGVKTVRLTVGGGGRKGEYTDDSSLYNALPGGDSKLTLGDEDWVVAYGGGAGGRWNNDGGAGGCGGGAGCNVSTVNHVGGAATCGLVAEKGGSLTANVYGCGGGGTPTSVGQQQGAGGGGAGAAGQDAKKGSTSGAGGAGGAGRVSLITGEAVNYAGGGGGGNSGSAASAACKGGVGGGGNGGVSSSSKANVVAAQPGADGFGGGGGAGGNYAAGARGGGGVVIIRFAPGPAPEPEHICEWTGKAANDNWTQRENWTDNTPPSDSGKSFVKFPEIAPDDPLAVWNVVVNKPGFSASTPACDNFTAENGMVISGGNPLFAYVNKDADNPYQMFFNGWDGRTLCVTGAGTALEICRKSYTNARATFQRGVLFAKDGGLIRITGLSFSDNHSHRMIASNANSRIEFEAVDKTVAGAGFNGYEVAGNYKQRYEAHDGGMVTLNGNLTFAKQSWPTFVADGGWINFGTQDGTSYKFNATLSGSSTLIADHGGTIRMGSITPQDAPVVDGSVSFPGTTETVDGVSDTVIECRNNSRIRFSGSFNLPGAYTSVPTLSISGENPLVQAEDASVLGSSKTGAMEFLIAPRPGWSATEPRVESIFATLTIYANVRYTIDLSAFASMTADFRFAIAGAGDGKALTYTPPTTPVRVVGLSEGTYEVALVKEGNILYLDVSVKHPYTMLMLK